MAENDENTSKDKDKSSLVLTIFKGENFVCKTTPGMRCLIEAKCCDQILQSGAIPISATNSEPAFNLQLAWKFSKRKLSELRGSKTAVKVRCLLLDHNKEGSEVGYVVLYLQNAFPWSGDIDASKADSYPLLGTKGQWKNYHPKLIMQLHTENYSIEQLITSPSVQKKVVCKAVKHSSQRKIQTAPEKGIDCINTLDKTPRVEVIPHSMDVRDRFPWRISEEDGCFQLGEPSENDDLYIFNITIVTATNLHLLWNGRSPKKAVGNDYAWKVRYKAYGCEIKSDPFELSMEDYNRRTFIGDKSTARIRAYAPNFCEYLEEAAIEFHVIRYEVSPNQALINEEVMGVSFAELKDLAQSAITELRATLEIVSEWGYPKTIDSLGKPEVRVVFNLEATPGFFRVNKESTTSDVNVNRHEDLAVTPPRPNDGHASENENLQTSASTPPEPSRDNEQPRTSGTTSPRPNSGRAYGHYDHRITKTVTPPLPTIAYQNDTVDNILQEMNELALANSIQEDSRENHSHVSEPSSDMQPPSNKQNQYSQDDVRDFFYNNHQNISTRQNNLPTEKFSVKPNLSASSSESSNISPPERNKNEGEKYEKVSIPTDIFFKTTDDLRIWQAEKKDEFHQELKRKERAYLRILAEEAAARDEQREKLMAQKLHELKRKEKELRILKETLAEREEKAQRNELEFAQVSQKATLNNTAILENAKLSIRKMQEEHKIEVSTLRRRNDEYEAELQKCKGKLDILQRRLDEKEEYINNLKAEKYEGPDSRLSEKLKLLEQENKLLKKQIIDCERSKDQYKKQSQALCSKIARLQDERDKQLKDENENLRFQILASKEHKELKKERKAVSDLSQQIRTLQDHKKPASKVPDRRKSDKSKNSPQKENLLPLEASNEDEIKRLTEMRHGLLNTGAYTKYDRVIKEMERRIVGLAEGQLSK